MEISEPAMELSAVRHLASGLALATALAALGLASSGCETVDIPEAKAESVILITLDTWRADAFGAGGDPEIRTPAIDRFFRRSIQFAEAYSPVPSTLASHTSMLTGAWPTHHGVPANLWPVPEDILSLAEILSERDFSTAAFLSSAVLNKTFRLGQGFDVYNFKPVALARDDSPWRPAFRTLHRAQTWWESTPGRRFLWVHLWEAHFPYEPNPLFVEVYDPGYEGEAVGTMEYLIHLWKYRGSMAEPDREHLIALYHAEITGLDRFLGRFLDELDTEDALIVLTSDHGESLGEHNLPFKHGPHVYRGDVQVPLAVLSPGAAPAVAGALVRTIDFPRTTLRQLGLDDRMLPEESADLMDWVHAEGGLPVFGVASSPSSELEDGTYPSVSMQRVVRLPGAALVETPFRNRREWFYRDADPGELSSSRVPKSSLADSLRSELDDWIEDARYRPGYAPITDSFLREQVRSLGYLD